VDNGSATNHAPFKGQEVETFYGRCRLIVKSTKQPGSIQLKVTADGVDGAETTLATLSPDDAKLVEAARNRDKIFRERNQKYSRHSLSRVSPLGNSDKAASPSEVGEKSTGSGTLQVAPVFQHGPGQHADSLVASRNKKPPTWSERDARIVIQDEAKKLGVEFTVDGKMPSVEGIRSTQDGKALSPEAVPQDRQVAMVFDGVSQDGKVAFEVLTSEDIPDRSDNTDRITDFLAAAQNLAEELKTKSGNSVAGVFYDPLVAKGAVPDEDPLRQQVRDFVAWLKKEDKWQ
jgi:hypothetical protein